MDEKTTKIRLLKAKTSACYNAAEEKEKNILGRKIEAARRAKKYSLRRFAELLQERGIDVEYQAPHKWEKGVTVPNAYQLFAISDALEIPDISQYFMQMGEGLNAEGMKKLNDFREDLLASGRYKPEPVEKQSPVRYIEMPVSRLGASAGTGEFLSEENIELMRFPESAVPKKADFAVRVVGDSMEPVYQDHQLVWVQICNTLCPGEVGVFVLDGYGYIKAYDEREPEDDSREDYTDSYGFVHKQQVLVSYNEKYGPKVVKPGMTLKICGRVLN